MRTLLLACLVCLPLFGQAAQSPPNTVEPPKVEKGQIPANKKEAEQLPVGSTPSRSQLDSSEHDAKTTGKDPNGDPDSKPDWWMIMLTAGLVFVGAGQVLVLIRQTHILNGGLVQTRVATELTRQSLVLTQRPKISLRTLILDEPTYGNRFLSAKIGEPIFNPDVPVEGTLLVVNTGSSQAVVRDTYCRVMNSGDPERLPRTFLERQQGGISLLPTGTRLAPGQRARCTFKGVGPSVLQVIRMGSAGAESSMLYLYVVGWIDYADELEYVRRTSFCRRYDRGTDRFLPIADADFELEE